MAFAIALLAYLATTSLGSIYLSSASMMACCCATCVICSTALMVWPSSTPAFWAIALSFGFAQAPMYALGVSLCQSFVSMDGRAMFTLVVGASIGKFLIPIAITSLFDFVGPFSFPVAIFLSTSGCAFFFVVLMVAGRRRRRRMLQAQEKGRERGAAAGGAGAGKVTSTSLPNESTAAVAAASSAVAASEIEIERGSGVRKLQQLQPKTKVQQRDAWQ